MTWEQKIDKMLTSFKRENEKICKTYIAKLAEVIK